VLGAAAPGEAAPPATRQACLDAYVAGQERKIERRFGAAREALEVCSQPSCPRDLARECAAWLREVESATPSLSLRALDELGRPLADARVSVDGKAETGVADAPVDVDPGEHQLRFVAPGHEPRQVSVDAVAGRKGLVVEARLAPTPAPVAPAPAPAPAPLVARKVPVDAWVWLGLGALAGGAGAYLGVTTLQRYDDLGSSCRPRCAHEDVDALRSRALGADIALGLAVALVGVGVYRVVAAPSVPVTLSIAPDHARLRAEF
jgi:hypothetical protein